MGNVARLVVFASIGLGLQGCGIGWSGNLANLSLLPSASQPLSPAGVTSPQSSSTAQGVGILQRGDPPSSTLHGGEANTAIVLSLQPTYRFLGRFSPGEANLLAPQVMSWGDSAIVARVTGTSQVSVALANVKGQGSYTLDAVSAQGNGSATFDPSVNISAITNLDPTSIYTVTFRKHTEALYSSAVFSGFVLDANASYAPPPALAARRIEVIGDSISTGYGNLGSVATCTADATNEDSHQAYGPLAAATLGAEVRVVAWAGHGAYQNYGGSTTETMPQLWTRSDATDSTSTWDPSRWVPQVVVINLGTNDFTDSELNRSAFIETYIEFLVRLRSAYPRAAIIASIGPMLTGDNLANCASDLQRAVSARSSAGDSAVYFLQYAVIDDSTGAGCSYHPNLTTHASMASALVSQINDVARW